MRGVTMAVLNTPLVMEQAAFRWLVPEVEAITIEAERFRSADGLAFVLDDPMAYQTGQGRVHVIRKAVDTARFSPVARPDTGLPPEAFVLGFSGSLTGWTRLCPPFATCTRSCARHIFWCWAKTPQGLGSRAMRKALASRMRLL